MNLILVGVVLLSILLIALLWYWVTTKAKLDMVCETLVDVYEQLGHVPLGSGVCCCGEPMELHNCLSDHSPVDSGEHYVSCTMAQIKNTLDLIK